MSIFAKFRALPIGFAMFSMFFGAGNIIYPLALGKMAGEKAFFAITGFFLTAVLMPILGVIAMILFDGDRREFFGKMGKGPGFLLALFTISLLGPLGSTPRCIALSYSTLKDTLPFFSQISFSVFACTLLFIFTVKKEYILSILGWILTPILLVSLLSIILLGITSGSEVQKTSSSSFTMFTRGLEEGYNTMDLLAAFFFSSTILNLLKAQVPDSALRKRDHLKTAFYASGIGGILLTLVYFGFSYIAAFHAGDLNIPNEELLSKITLQIAGPYAGFLVSLTIAIACLTTAIALMAAFADFMQKEVFRERFSYTWILRGAAILTFFVSIFEFSGISAFLFPILQIFYPILIVLTLMNIFLKVEWMPRTLKKLSRES